MDQFTVGMYVLQDETLYGNTAAATRAASTAASDDKAGSNPGIEVIKRHLEGHGRKKRSFWTEMSLFLVDRNFRR